MCSLGWTLNDGCWAVHKKKNVSLPIRVEDVLKRNGYETENTICNGGTIVLFKLIRIYCKNVFQIPIEAYWFYNDAIFRYVRTGKSCRKECSDFLTR